MEQPSRRRMMVPRTTRELIELIRKSKLLSDESLKQCEEREEEFANHVTELLQQLVSDGQLTDFQGQLLAQGRWEGFFVGSYKVLHPLGRGGMSRVYLAKHTTLHRQVALKILPSMRTTEEMIARFHREGRALAALHHPNIIRAYVMDREGELLYLAMEYAEGLDLQRLVTQQGALGVEQSLELILQAARGLQHAHEAGWVHRDVKPSNLLLTEKGVLKVLDLGLARWQDDEGDMLTRARGNILGSADYLAPEQAIDSHSVDARADIYSLGATLYFLLTARPPFDGGCAVQKVARHHSVRARPLSTIRPGISPMVEAVVDKMMAKRPEHRFSSMADLIGTLEQFEEREGVSVVPPYRRRTFSNAVERKDNFAPGSKFTPPASAKQGSRILGWVVRILRRMVRWE